MELSSLLGDLDLARSDEEKRRKEKIHSRVLRGKRNSHQQLHFQSQLMGWGIDIETQQ